MKELFYYLIVLLLVSCNSTPLPGKEDRVKDSLQTINPGIDQKPDYSMAVYHDTVKTEEELEEETATFHIVVADTGFNYYTLRNEMLQLHQALNIPVDTMGRTYNPSKDLIALPENDQDELFAGDYYPRRFPSNSLSLEYLGLYQDKVGEKTIALVAGIFESPNSADTLLAAIRRINSKAFVVKADIYTGCIH